MNATDNMIFAFSMSPQYVIDNFEEKTSNLGARIENIKLAQKNNFITRLCFDPLIYFKNWKQSYKQLISNKEDASEVQKQNFYMQKDIDSLSENYNKLKDENININQKKIFNSNKNLISEFPNTEELNIYKNVIYERVHYCKNVILLVYLHPKNVIYAKTKDRKHSL